MSHHETIVIGGGIAGMTAIYELSKYGKDALLIEAKDYLGGNIKTVNVNVDGKNVPIDFGAFEIFPWYKTILDLVSEMDLNEYVDFDYYDFYKNIPKDQMNIRQTEIKDDSVYISPIKHDYPIKDKINVVLFIIKLMSLSDKYMGFYRTDFSKSIFDKKSLYRILIETFGYNSDIDEIVGVFHDSYTYGLIEYIPAETVIPIIAKSMIISKETRMSIGLSRLIEKMAQYVKNSNQIHINEKVLDIIYIPDIGYEIITNKSFYTCKNIIDTSYLIKKSNMFLNKCSLLNSHDQEYSFYTSYYTIVMDVENDLSKLKWIGRFEVNNKNKFQIKNYAALNHLYGVNVLLIYIECKDHNDDNCNLSKEQLMDILYKESKTIPFLNQIKYKKMLHYEYFSHVMPIRSYDIIDYLNKTNGMNNYYRAGHYMGTFPTIESASFTGKRAAHMILGDINEFDKIYKDKDERELSLWRKKTILYPFCK